MTGGINNVIYPVGVGRRRDYHGQTQNNDSGGNGQPLDDGSAPDGRGVLNIIVPDVGQGV